MYSGKIISIMNTQFLEIQNLDSSNLALAQVWYESEILPDPDARTEAWKNWHAFFSKKDLNTDWEYRWSYFRWYTDLTWRRLNQLTVEEVAQIAFGRQLSTALRLDFDVWEELVLYLNTLIDPQAIESAYLQIQESFFSSNVIIGLVSQNPVTVQQSINNLRIINQENTDSLRSAELFAKIKPAFTEIEPGTEAFWLSTPEVFFDRFVGLVNFFLGVDKDHIWFVVDSFINPERYKEGSQLAEKESAIAEVVLTEPTVEEKKVSKVSYADIKNMIEARFTRDTSGEFANLDGVLALLDSLATDQGDDQIRELYYFDEGTGKFQWNEALLT